MVKVKVKVGHFNAFNAFNANGVFALVWMKTQIQSLSRGAAFGGKNSGFPGNAEHKAALQTLLYQPLPYTVKNRALQARWHENETNRPITAE